MPKENTHLYFAHQVVEVIKDERLANRIRQEMDCFYFGSVLPDAFFYSASKDVRAISEYIHGRQGNLTNEFVFDLIKKAKETRNERDLIVALGVITHCVLDIVFHPVIYYLSGNYYDPDPKKADDAVFLHRHLETALDRQVNQNFYYSKLIKVGLLDDLSFDEVIQKKFSVSQFQLISVLKRKALLLRFLNHDWLYYIIYFLHITGIMRSKVLLGIFYGSLYHDKRSLDEFIEYRDVITGEDKRTTIQELFSKARHLAVDRINAATAYYQGDIKREEAMQVIKGESLSTGLEGVPVSAIKYVKQI